MMCSLGSKSVDRKVVGVRVSPGAPLFRCAGAEELLVGAERSFALLTQIAPRFRQQIALDRGDPIRRQSRRDASVVAPLDQGGSETAAGLTEPPPVL